MTKNDHKLPKLLKTYAQKKGWGDPAIEEHDNFHYTISKGTPPNDKDVIHFNYSKKGNVSIKVGNPERERELNAAWTKFLKNPPRIFIDYAFKYNEDNGHKDDVVKILKKWGFVPVVLEEDKGKFETILGNLESLIASADYGIVLISPDDEMRKDKSYSARPNVWVELGMLLMALKDKRPATESRLLILRYDDDDHQVEMPSDIFGLVYDYYASPKGDDQAGDQGDTQLEAILFDKLAHLFPPLP